jgi:hypothetical protein
MEIDSVADQESQQLAQSRVASHVATIDRINERVVVIVSPIVNIGPRRDEFLDRARITLA